MKTAHKLHFISENNYGFAGKIFIEYIVKEVIKNKNNAIKLLENIQDNLKQRCTVDYDNAKLDNIAIVCLGDYYSSISVFGETKEKAWNEAIELGIKMLTDNKDTSELDTIDRAWNFVVDWIISNKNRFVPDSTPCYGKIEKNTIYILPSILRQALEDNEFNYLKVTRGFKERQYIETKIDSNGHNRMQIAKRINGIVQKCFCIKGVITDDSGNRANALN